MALTKVSIDEFERRIKKLVDSEQGDEINLKQLIECFKDHPVLKEIEKEDSVLRKLLTHNSLSSKKKGYFYIPYLMIVGILYCASNPKLKA